ncbi:hypothetical protein [Spiroplasma endosymbiont of Panorpa germanica]|uniref:hypothetical protein n=1 Tax=Spiroplasma endosymbiont of Panorpa germanica TaxID=3066314 RepID=UPI0030D4C356
MNHIYLFWLKIKKTLMLKSTLIAMGFFVLISILFSLLLMINSLNIKTVDQLSTNWYIWLSVKNFFQIISLGLIVLMVAIRMFVHDVENGILNLQLRSGRKSISVFLQSILASLVIIWSLIIFTFILDLTISMFNPFKYFISKSIGSYLAYIVFSFTFISFSLLIILLFKVTYSFVFLILIVFSLSFSSMNYSLFTSQKQKDIQSTQVSAEWEVYNSMQYYKILKQNNLYDEMKESVEQLYNEDDSNDWYSNYFSLTQLPKIEFEFIKTIKNYSAAEFKVNDSDSKGLPFIDIKNFNYLEFYKIYDFQKVLPQLISSIEKSNDEKSRRYLPIFYFLKEHEKDLIYSLYLETDNELNLLQRGRFISQEVFEYYDYNYGSMYASWLVMNFTKSVFSVSDQLIEYLLDNSTSINKINFLINPWSRLPQMIILNDQNIYLDNIFQSLSFSGYGGKVNGHINFEFKPGYEDILDEIIKSENKMKIKNGFEPDFKNISNKNYQSFYDLIDNFKYSRDIAIWLVFTTDILFGIFIMSLSYLIYNKKYLR